MPLTLKTFLEKAGFRKVEETHQGQMCDAEYQNLRYVGIRFKELGVIPVTSNIRGRTIEIRTSTTLEIEYAGYIIGRKFYSSGLIPLRVHFLTDFDDLLCKTNRGPNKDKKLRSTRDPKRVTCLRCRKFLNLDEMPGNDPSRTS